MCTGSGPVIEPGNAALTNAIILPDAVYSDPSWQRREHN